MLICTMPEKRPQCPHCQRLFVNCLCQLCHPINNQTKVLILQHPKESRHAKGSVPLLSRSLQHCQVWVDEVFEQLEQRLEFKQYNNLLLYPEAESSYIEISPNDNKPKRLILIDATWRKSFKMLQLNPILKTLPRISPKFEKKPAYSARKAAKPNQYSSLEACCRALQQLDGQQPDYDKLQHNFGLFNQRLLQQRQR